MITPRRILGAILAWAVLLGIGLGCAGNPGYFPHLLPPGRVIPTHAKPGGASYFANFDPHACKLEVTPVFCSNPLRSEQVVIATVLDAQGQPRRKRRVEWLLEGVGTILEVDESGHWVGRGYKVDNKYAVSYTDYVERLVTRGNDNPADDFKIYPGQTWCVISSALEGQTSLTVYAPEIHDRDKNRVYVKMHWSDAEWQFPQAAAVRAGSAHTFSTTVRKFTTRQPMSGYRVRYQVVEGAPAVLTVSPNQGFALGDQDVTALTDADGQAAVRIMQLHPQPGRTKLRVEIVRPSHEDGTGDTVIGQTDTYIDWQAPSLSLQVDAPPAALMTERVPITVAVRNTGNVDAQAMTVQSQVPEGMILLESNPPAQVEGNLLVWNLPALPQGQQHTVQAFFRPARLGETRAGVTVQTVDGITAQRTVLTRVTTARIAAECSGPEMAVVGQTIPIRVAVHNPGSGPAANVKLALRYGPGLVHVSQTNPVEITFDHLGPGLTRSADVLLQVKQPGSWEYQLTTTADGDLRAEVPPRRVEVRQPALQVALRGPDQTYLNHDSTWTLTVRNTGEVPIANVFAGVVFPPALTYRHAEPQGVYANGQTTWSMGTFAPHETRSVRFNALGAQLTSSAALVGTASGEPMVQRAGQWEVAVSDRKLLVEERFTLPITVLGVPALQLEVVDAEDPIAVGRPIRYTVKVINQGTLPAQQVELIAQLPPQLKPRRGSGPIEGRIDGQRVLFPPLDGLQPGRGWTFTIDAEAVAFGDARFRVELRCPQLSVPLHDEESTRIVPLANADTAGQRF